MSQFLIEATWPAIEKLWLTYLKQKPTAQSL